MRKFGKSGNKIIELVRELMRQTYERYPDDIIIDLKEKWYWDTSGDVPTLVHAFYYAGKKVRREFLPSSDFYVFLHNLEFSYEPSEFIEWCVNGLRAWFEQMYAQAEKDEERIKEELNSSEAYLEYKSLRTIQKLEN